METLVRYGTVADFRLANNPEVTHFSAIRQYPDRIDSEIFEIFRSSEKIDTDIDRRVVAMNKMPVGTCQLHA